MRVKRSVNTALRDVYPPSTSSGEMLLLRIRLTLSSGAGAGSTGSMGSAGMVGSAYLTGVGAGSGSEDIGVSGSEGDEEATGTWRGCRGVRRGLRGRRMQGVSVSGPGRQPVQVCTQICDVPVQVPAVVDELAALCPVRIPAQDSSFLVPSIYSS